MIGGGKMLADKFRVKEYVDELKADMLDLCHCDELYTEMWIERAKGLRLVGAWWDYMVLISHAKRYIKRYCPQYLKRFESFLKRVRL